MNTQEDKIEDFLKEQTLQVNIPRELFDRTIDIVTNTDQYRNIYQKANTPSIYQIINNFLMKKIAYIGVPLLIVALIAIVAINKNSGDTQVTYQEPKKEQGQVVNKAVIASDSSIDSILASFKSDADSDATIASSESEDDAALQAELQEYNNIKSTDYANNI